MPITAFIGVRISWLMLARNIDFMAVASSALWFAAPQFRGALLHQRIELLFPRLQTPYPQFVSADNQAHKRQTHHAPEPRCRPPGRQDRECEAYPVLVPDVIVIGCLDAKDKSSCREAGIGGLAAPAIHLVPF